MRSYFSNLRKRFTQYLYNRRWDRAIATLERNPRLVAALTWLPLMHIHKGIKINSLLPDNQLPKHADLVIRLLKTERLRYVRPLLAPRDWDSLDMALSCDPNRHTLLVPASIFLKPLVQSDKFLSVRQRDYDFTHECAGVTTEEFLKHIERNTPNQDKCFIMSASIAAVGWSTTTDLNILLFGVRHSATVTQVMNRVRRRL